MALTTDQSAIYTRIYDSLETWGLVSPDDTELADLLYNMIVDNESETYIMNEFRKSNAYAKRFPVLAEINKKYNLGWSEGDYIREEEAYKTALGELGDAASLFMSSDQYAEWMLANLSPTQIQQRVRKATDYLYMDTNPAVKDALRSQYGLSDGQMVAYLLSPERVTAELEKEYDSLKRRANVKASAQLTGMSGVSNALINEVADNAINITSDFTETQRRFSNLAEQGDDIKRLGKISDDLITDDELVAGEFSSGTRGAKANKKRKRLASQERARFSGSSGLRQGSLGSSGLGSR